MIKSRIQYNVCVSAYMWTFALAFGIQESLCPLHKPPTSTTLSISNTLTKQQLSRCEELLKRLCITG